MAISHQVLLAVSLIVLTSTATRLASALTPAPSERVLAAVPIGAAAAGIQALGLGLVGLGGEPWALCAAVVATWIGVRAVIPAPDPSLAVQLTAAWTNLSAPGRFATGAIAGAGLAWTVWLVRYPAYGWDNLTYHVPEIVTWVQKGTPGSIEPILPGWVVGNYPLTNEVLLTWGTGLSRTFVWLTVWPSLMVALLAGASWVGLRALSVPRAASALSAVSLCTIPVLTSHQFYGATTDLPALSWLVAAAALCATATRSSRAGLLAPALIAAALAVGTKTTTAPLALAVLGLAAYRLRPQLRPVAGALGLAAGAALLIGGTWYVRNLIQHGSPTWPFFPMPWGDPAPPTKPGFGRTFLQRPVESLARLDDAGYVKDIFLGSALALAAALIAPFFARRREVTAGAVATAISIFLWTNAPATGSPTREFKLETDAAFLVGPRYLLPGVAVATLTIALAANGRGRAALVWTAVLGAVALLNLWQLFGLGYPNVPSPLTPAAGAVLLGGLGALAAMRLPRPALLRPAAAVLGVLVLGVAFALAGNGIVDRHIRMDIGDAGLVGWFEGPGADGRPIHMAPFVHGILSGDDLERTVEPIPRRESCERIERHAREAWVVVSKVDIDVLFGPSTPRPCVEGWQPRYEDAAYWVYSR